jgi:hypothetical protein
MLLRRVIEHVRNQNWFAVAVDFLIVVVGVFIGLQVQDWNDSRQRAKEEQKLLNRLLAESGSLLKVHERELGSLKSLEDVVTAINPVLFSLAPSRALTEGECRFILGSHVIRRPSDELIVLDELIDTGRFDFLQDSGLKTSLRDYLLLRERGRAHYGEVINELFRLHSRFPELLAIELRPDSTDEDGQAGGLSGEGFRWSRKCNVDGMRASPAFLNEYADNLSRLGSVTRFVDQRRARLQAINEKLQTLTRTQ